MLRTIFTASVAATILALSATVAFAQTELDRDAASLDPAKGTVILKIDRSTHQITVLNANYDITSNEDAQQLAKNGNFVSLPSNEIKNELEKDKVQTSMYVVTAGYNYFPAVVVNAVSIQPYYAYTYSNCDYLYYPSANYTYWNTYGWNGYSGWGGYFPSYFGYGVGYGYRGGYGYGYRGGFAYGRGPYGGYAYNYRGAGGRGFGFGRH